jgi:hypothetical protein
MRYEFTKLEYKSLKLNKRKQISTPYWAGPMALLGPAHGLARSTGTSPMALMPGPTRQRDRDRGGGGRRQSSPPVSRLAKPRTPPHSSSQTASKGGKGWGLSHRSELAGGKAVPDSGEARRSALKLYRGEAKLSERPRFWQGLR